MSRRPRLAASRHDWTGRLLFELIVIVLGVTIAFALEGARRDREEALYRHQMIAAMVPLFDDFARHNQSLYAMEARLAAFERAIARGAKPMIPVFREAGSERAPVRSWDGIVSTGIPRALPPKLYMDLSLFFSRQESLSERYVRYISFAEAEILPWRSDPAHFFDPATGGLKPRYAASIDQLRGMIASARMFEAQARDLKRQVQQLD